MLTQGRSQPWTWSPLGYKGIETVELVFDDHRAARLLMQDAAAKKAAGERADLEAGMAKLFASEMCQEVTLDALRIHGGNGYAATRPCGVRRRVPRPALWRDRI